MKVLITGAAGFIGAHVARALVERGDSVVGIDSFTDYYDPRLKEDRVAALAPELSVERIDVSDKEAIGQLFVSHTFDRVCHLAAQAGVRHSITDPWSYISANVLGTQNILEYAHRSGNVPVVYASSSSVYGDADSLPLSEDASCVTPVSLYAATKRSTELMAHVYTHMYGLPTTGLRFFTVYGPWGRPDMAYYTFTKALLAGRPIELFNQGNLQRDFTYIDDIVSGVGAALSDPQGYQLYNLGRGAPVTLRDFVASIERATGAVAQVIEKPMQLGDVHATFADTTRARKALGYDPKTTLDEGIASFVKWYVSYYNV